MPGHNPKSERATTNTPQNYTHGNYVLTTLQVLATTIAESAAGAQYHLGLALAAPFVEDTSDDVSNASSSLR